MNLPLGHLPGFSESEKLIRGGWQITFEREFRL